MIASLQSSPPDADFLRELDEQKKSRDELEMRFLALSLENSELKGRIKELESENSLLKEKHTSAILDNENAQRQLVALKKDNQLLNEELTTARAQHQALLNKYEPLSSDSTLNANDDNISSSSVSELEGHYIKKQQEAELEISNLRSQINQQRTAIVAYKNDIDTLASALSANHQYEARWKALDQTFIRVQQQNAQLINQLSSAEAALLLSQKERNELLEKLSNTEQALDIQENNSIAMTTAMTALQSQVNARLLNVRWQRPNDISLNNAFEIIVTARVQPSLSGASYSAELITDSAIEMISNPIVTAVVQSGGLQWRWRVSGLSEDPNAALNVVVNQLINLQDQTFSRQVSFSRQVYRGTETVSLVNTNLFEKYGYWSGVIVLGLLGGFFVGRLSRRKKSDIEGQI